MKILIHLNFNFWLNLQIYKHLPPKIQLPPINLIQKFNISLQDKNGHSPNSPLKSPSKIPSYQTRPASITPKTRSRSTSKQRLSLKVSPEEQPEPLIKSMLWSFLWLFWLTIFNMNCFCDQQKFQWTELKLAMHHHQTSRRLHPKLDLWKMPSTSQVSLNIFGDKFGYLRPQSYHFYGCRYENWHGKLMDNIIEIF